MKIKYLIPFLGLTLSSPVFGQILINFDDLPGGGTIAGNTIITNQYASLGVNFALETSGSQTGTDLRTFDSSDMSLTWDRDLWTPTTIGGANNTDAVWAASKFGNGQPVGGTPGPSAENVLIIQAGYGPRDPGGLNLSDDDRRGGSILITFDDPVIFQSIGILDMDDDSGSTINFYSDFGATTLIGSSLNIDGPPPPQDDDGSYQEFNSLDVFGVRSMRVNFTSSGAITGLEANVIPEPSTYTMIFGSIALGLVFIRRRFQKDTQDA